MPQLPIPADLETLAQEILSARKYRSLGITPATVVDLLAKELLLHHNQKEAVKEVRRKLHNIVADYLGDADFASAGQQMEEAIHSGDPAQVRKVCAEILSSHASTRERLSILDEFYPRLFALIGLPSLQKGRPQTILDLACGLNPFSFPWMGLPVTTRYYAYDINQPRVDFINRFFTLLGMPPLAEAEDILVHPPQIAADVAFFFKEAHRFEQRQHGCNLAFWQALQVRWLLVSLPTSSLTGRHSLVDGHRRLVYNILAGLSSQGSQSWQVTEVLFANEIVFCIDKGGSNLRLIQKDGDCFVAKPPRNDGWDKEGNDTAQI